MPTVSLLVREVVPRIGHNAHRRVCLNSGHRDEIVDLARRHAIGGDRDL